MNTIRDSKPEERWLSAAKQLFTLLGDAFDTRFSVKLWDGSIIPLGQNVDTPFYVAIADTGTLGSILRWPSPENILSHYVKGSLDFGGGDLTDFIAIFRERHAKKKLRKISSFALVWAAWPLLFARSTNRATIDHRYVGDETGRVAARDDKAFIQFHYDVSNGFYQNFLDPELQYSCAYFRSFEGSLEQAQRDKLEMICRKLQLKPGETFLDIGCGWGGLVCYAAQNFGVRAHGVTLSQAQYDYCQEKIERLGLQDRVRVELRDYRSLSDKYDKIASIGMYEHVGIANLRSYFKKVYSLLPDRGMLLNHGITNKASLKGGKRRMPLSKKLILKYIFPGSELDDIGHTIRVMEGSGFEIHDVEGWREHYALTCKHWYQRLAAHQAEAIREVGPERYRMWLLYLAGVSAGFTGGTMRLYQVVASKHKEKGVSGQPETREHLYRASR